MAKYEDICDFISFLEFPTSKVNYIDLFYKECKRAERENIPFTKVASYAQKLRILFLKLLN